MQYSDLSNRPANRAAVTRALAWPDGRRSALFLSFDFDAETAWFDDDPNQWRNAVTLSHGGFGARTTAPTT